MKQQLEEFFHQKFKAPKNEIEKLVQFFTTQTVSKDEILIYSGEICRYFYFVNKGSLKACFIAPQGQETIRIISFENQFLSTIHSFINQETTNEYICACENSEVLLISYTHFKEALSKIPFFKDFYIYLLERTYTNNHWRIESFLRLDAKQRYTYLLENKPELVQRLSNKNLAHYIGITQESLSRIKSKV